MSDCEHEGYECDHDEYNLDILTGIANCGMCGFRWYASAKQIDAYHLFEGQPPQASQEPQDRHNLAGASRLTEIGIALCGPHWQSQVAKELDVGLRTVQRWAKGKYAIPAGVWADLAKLCRKRGLALGQWADRLEA